MDTKNNYESECLCRMKQEITTNYKYKKKKKLKYHKHHKIYKNDNILLLDIPLKLFFPTFIGCIPFYHLFILQWYVISFPIERTRIV